MALALLAAVMRRSRWMVVIPLVMGLLCVVSQFGVTAAIATFQFFALQRKKLELRRWEIEQRMDQARLAAQMPPWLDYADPQDVAAWRTALQETWALVGRGPKRIES